MAGSLRYESGNFVIVIIAMKKPFAFELVSLEGWPADISEKDRGPSPEQGRGNFKLTHYPHLPVPNSGVPLADTLSLSPRRASLGPDRQILFA